MYICDLKSLGTTLPCKPVCACADAKSGSEEATFLAMSDNCISIKCMSKNKSEICFANSLSCATPFPSL